MLICWDSLAWEDYVSWSEYDKNTFQKINKIIRSIERTPFEGLGKPEPLKFKYSGYWSRRITLEHRLIYKVKENAIYIIHCRHHYKK